MVEHCSADPNHVDSSIDATGAIAVESGVKHVVSVDSSQMKVTHEFPEDHAIGIFFVRLLNSYVGKVLDTITVVSNFGIRISSKNNSTSVSYFANNFSHPVSNQLRGLFDIGTNVRREIHADKKYVNVRPGDSDSSSSTFDLTIRFIYGMYFAKTRGPHSYKTATRFVAVLGLSHMAKTADSVPLTLKHINLFGEASSSSSR